MPKISNQEIYELVPEPTLLDYLIGTKKGDKRTHTFNFKAIIKLINAVNGVNNIQYQFSDGTNPDVDFTTIGQFFTNINLVNTLGYDQLIFNKNTIYVTDLTPFFIRIGQGSNYVITIKKSENPNDFVKLKVVSFTNSITHFSFGVELFDNSTTLDYINEEIYSIYFDVDVLASIPLYGKWKVEEKAIGNTGNGIEFDDLARGRISLSEWCSLGRYKNYTADNNVHNPLNYEILSTSGLISQ
ncbi:hypothetical protein [Flavobacterium sp.]|uniref:hypothetical protein n=1 Tax=Flavobacterium sp. TaxID=239 RepID=UPI0037529A41